MFFFYIVNVRQLNNNHYSRAENYALQLFEIIFIFHYHVFTVYIYRSSNPHTSFLYYSSCWTCVKIYVFISCKDLSSEYRMDTVYYAMFSSSKTKISRQIHHSIIQCKFQLFRPTLSRCFFEDSSAMLKGTFVNGKHVNVRISREVFGCINRISFLGTLFPFK
jgi:hypothetical protein